MTLIDAFSVNEGRLSVSLDGYDNILIMLPSPDALSEQLVEDMVHEFESRLSSLLAPSDLGLFERLRELREKFFTPAGRQEVSSQIKVFDSITVHTMTPSTVLTMTVIEADGDIITRVNESAVYAYHEDLLRLHREAVKYATGAWRKRLLGIRDLIRLGAKLHRALLLVSLGSLIGSAAAWSLGELLAAAFLGLGVLSFFFSTFLAQFNFKNS
ncbi:hypothetical protein KAT55_00850 [Candidatus Bathyarchaeota archaeon]|nr:hypothetical protein [Candidatus Bathyarchaeota archaeon]